MRNFSLIRILKNLIGHLKARVAYFINLAKIQKSNPTGRFHLGVRASNSTFGQYNVIFKGVTIVNSKIGSHTYIQEKSVIVNAQIGKFCSIASNVSVGPGIHKTDGVSTHPAFYLIDTPLVKTFSLNDDFESSKQTNIGNDVWIGEKVIIIDGVNIGTGAIIAAGAVVTKDVEPYSIAGGVPARHIKYRFSEDLIQGLLRSEWWNKDDLWLKEHAEDFSDVNKFMKL